MLGSRIFLLIARMAYFSVGVTAMPVFSQWVRPQFATSPLIRLLLVLWGSVTAASAAICAIPWPLARIAAIAGLTISAVASLLPMFSYSPFILGAFGVAGLSILGELFASYSQLFPFSNEREIKWALSLSLGAFGIFGSAMMVGFIIGWVQLHAEVLKGIIDQAPVFAGIGSNVLIAVYYCVGAALVFLEGTRVLRELGTMR